MTRPNLLARNLATALLAGSADLALACERCEQVLGERPKWLRSMLARLLRRFEGVWNEHSHDALALAIEHAREMRRAYQGDSPPRLYSVSVVPAVMAPPRLNYPPTDLPHLPTVVDIALWLDMDLNELLWLSRFSRSKSGEGSQRFNHYHHFWKEKRTGGWRLIEIPKSKLRSVQRKLLSQLLDRISPHPSAHGFRKGHSTLTHALAHTGRAVVIRMDLQDFFLHVSASRVYGIYRALGYPKNAARLLTALCVHGLDPRVLRQPYGAGDYPFLQPTLDWHRQRRYIDPHLPQGAPTSPALANLCAYTLDARLHGLARSMRANYSRYADDLVFSGDEALSRRARHLPELVGAIALEEGFVLNHRKTRVVRSGARQRVTGIVVNEKLNIARQEFDHLKAVLHNCARLGALSQNREGHHDFRAHLLGKIGYVRCINASRGQRLLQLFQRVQSWD